MVRCLRGTIQPQHRHREQDRRLSLPDRTDHGTKAEHGRRENKLMLPIDYTPFVAERPNKHAEQGEVTDRPDHERGTLTNMIGEPPKRGTHKRGVGRVEKRHQPPFDLHAGHQQLLGRPLCRFVIQRRRVAMENQRPTGPEHRKVAVHDSARLSNNSISDERETDREADVCRDQPTFAARSRARLLRRIKKGAHAMDAWSQTASRLSISYRACNLDDSRRSTERSGSSHYRFVFRISFSIKSCPSNACHFSTLHQRDMWATRG